MDRANSQASVLPLSFSEKEELLGAIISKERPSDSTPSSFPLSARKSRPTSKRPFLENFLTEEEERQLATSSNRKDRRKIQNRVAQRAYRM
jgi:hypothetical protein